MARARISTPYSGEPQVFEVFYLSPNKDGSGNRQSPQRSHDQRGTFQIEITDRPGGGWTTGELSIMGGMYPGSVMTVLSTLQLNSVDDSVLLINVPMWPEMAILLFGTNPVDGSIDVHVVE